MTTKPKHRIPAPELKKIYGVYGNFYSQVLGDTEYACRSILEIIHHEHTPLMLNDILDYQPELVVIMMNPGSSKPLDENYYPITVTSTEEIETRRELTPTRPDTTQYQVMRLMTVLGISHARVLNVSDLRQPKSKVFQKTFARLEKAGHKAHSMFSPERIGEFKRLMGDSKPPLILGWGRDKEILPLAEQFLDHIKEYDTYGVVGNEERTLYGHPSPTLQSGKDAWLDEILSKLS